jgi:hypothetical protein
MAKKKLPEIQITELFLVKADWNRTYMAQIAREMTKDGEEIIRGSVVIEEGKAWSIGSNETELGLFLDDICSLKLDLGLHNEAGVTVEFAGEVFFLN